MLQNCLLDFYITRDVSLPLRNETTADNCERRYCSTDLQTGAANRISLQPNKVTQSAQDSATNVYAP